MMKENNFPNAMVYIVLCIAVRIRSSSTHHVQAFDAVSAISNRPIRPKSHHTPWFIPY